jgi:hypothetical protein
VSYKGLHVCILPFLPTCSAPRKSMRVCQAIFWHSCHGTSRSLDAKCANRWLRWLNSPEDHVLDCGHMPSKQRHHGPGHGRPARLTVPPAWNTQLPEGAPRREQVPLQAGAKPGTTAPLSHPRVKLVKLGSAPTVFVSQMGNCSIES